MMTLMAKDMDALGRMIAEATRVVAFTGAGISTESGIPDFRGPGGMWSKFRPVPFDDFLRSEEARREAWRRKFATHSAIEAAAPNRGHRAIAALAAENKVSAVITQNIDGLHQRSGLPDDLVIELHGNTTYAVCLDCAERHELDAIWRAVAIDETPPLCGPCGGLVKTATISFGQAMPESEMRRAEAATLACDLFLAIGSSLTVQPAAMFPRLAKQNGAQLVILNREPTALDGYADLVLNQRPEGAPPAVQAMLGGEAVALLPPFARSMLGLERPGLSALPARAATWGMGKTLRWAFRQS